MDNSQRKLLIEQLDKKFEKLEVLRNIEVPAKGWIHTIRTAMNMSLAQFAKRLKKTVATVNEIEKREEDKGISLKKLIEVAEALDCRFVYGFIPNNGSLSGVIEQRALQLANDIVARTSHTMTLEDQGNSDERIQNAVRERADKIKNEMPKYLWD